MWDERGIIRMNFYSGQETIVKVGMDGDLEEEGRRVESFEIAADEQLIGAELYHGGSNDFFHGVTWLKCKIAK